MLKMKLSVLAVMTGAVLVSQNVLAENPSTQFVD